MSYLPWHEVFFKILNHIADLIEEQAHIDLNCFLKELYHKDVPGPGTTFHVAYGKAHKVYTGRSPNTYTLPSIPDNVS